MMYGMGDVLAEQREEISSLQVENDSLRAIIDGLRIRNLEAVRQAYGDSKYKVVLSEICEELDLNPFGTECKCGADLSLSRKEVTGCGNCNLQNEFWLGER